MLKPDPHYKPYLEPEPHKRCPDPQHATVVTLESGEGGGWEGW
jgi:hypothetical protein